MRSDAAGYVIPYKGSPERRSTRSHGVARLGNGIFSVHLFVFRLMCAIWPTRGVRVGTYESFTTRAVDATAVAKQDVGDN